MILKRRVGFLGEMSRNELVNVSGFLRQHDSINTRKTYVGGLNLFLEQIYPDMKQKRGKREPVSLEHLDILAEKYITEDRITVKTY